MVVKCPSCGTRYHNPWESHADHARCSCCDEMVPLVAAKREYVVRPAETTPAGLGGIGMDDPLLAPRLRETALGGGSGSPSQALTYRVSAEAGGDAGPADEKLGPVDILLQSAQAEEEPEERRNPLRELLVTMLLTTVGIAAAYHLSRDQGLDPTLWVGAGGLWGLILGWLCIQWMRQRH